jgi:hypothetical protein
MRLIEQAVFTSIDTAKGAGYRVVARSPGVRKSDARELAAWGPTHDSILDPQPMGMSAARNGAAASFNFHPLPSGCYCISRTVLVGAAVKSNEWRGESDEWRVSSGEQGPGVFPALSASRADTHCLLLPVEVLARFGNNPWAVIDAASNCGLWRTTRESSDERAGDRRWPASPSVLAALSLEGGAAAADAALLERLAADLGPEAVAAMVQAAREAVCLAIAHASDPAALISGLFNCLPVECRLELSFATGLKFSPRRPFRIVAVPDDPAARQWIASYPNVVVLDLAPRNKEAGPASRKSPAAGAEAQRRSAQKSGKRDSTPALLLDGWSQLVHRALSCGRAEFLAAQVSRRRSSLLPAELPALGLQLLEELDRTERADERGNRRKGNDESRGAVPQTVFSRRFPPARAAHAAHRRFAGEREKGADSNFPERPGERFAEIASAPLSPDLSSRETLDMLEQLDDLVYEAISGQQGAMERLEAAWPRLAARLGAEQLAASREQYLRYALSIWDQCLGAEGLRQAARAVQAVDVLCLLFGDGR